MQKNMYFKKIRDRGAYDVISTVLITICSILLILPLVWLFTSAFKQSNEIYLMPPRLFSDNPTLKNFEQLFFDSGMPRWMVNSVLVSLFTTIGTIITALMAAYAFSKMSFPFKKTLYLTFIASIMVPNEVMIVPLFRLMLNFDLQNTIAGMALPGIASAMGFFMMKGFVDTIPNSLRESAKIDGANELTVFVKIVLPLCKPGIGALFILTFVRSWNNYLWQFLMATKKESMTLMAGIATLFSDIDPNMALKVAGAALSAVPMLIVFFAFQQYFTRGISSGAVKE